MIMIRGLVVLFALTSLAFSQNEAKVAQKPKLHSKVVGHVLDAYGEPVPMAEVWVGKANERIVEARTDGAGMFVLRAPLPGTWLHAKAQGKTSAHDYIQLSESKRQEYASFRLWDATKVKGVVEDAQGKPVAGAEVMAKYDVARILGFEPNATATSGENGEFTLENVPLGFIHFRAWKRAFGVSTETQWVRGADDSIILKLEPAKTSLVVKVKGLGEGEKARIRILPYANGSHQTLPPSVVAGETDAGGVWAVRGLPEYRLRISASASGYSFSPRNLDVDGGQANSEVEFTAIKNGSVKIKGRLVDGRGRPLIGQTLTCRAPNGGRRTTTETEADGAFIIDSPLAPGTEAVIFLSGSTYIMTQEETGNARFYSGRQTWHRFKIGAQPRLKLRAVQGASVEGRLVDENGNAARGRRVQLSYSRVNVTPRWSRLKSTSSDRDGRFRFGGLSTQKGEVRISLGPGGTTATDPFELVAGKPVKGIELVVPKLGIVEGVLRGKDGKPICGARVWLRNYDLAARGQTDGSVNEILTDRKGRYRYLDVLLGGHVVECYLNASRANSYRSEAFAVEAGATVRHDIDLSK